MRSRWAIIWLLPLVWVQTVGCRMDVPPEIRLSPQTVIPPRPVVVFWVDGLDIERFNALRAAGKLPNITRYLVDRGVTVCGAVASLPTITFANNVSFHTGLLPGHHGIVGNKWFDRHRLIFQDYGFIRTYQQVDDDFRATTIYEALADEYTATILSPVRRGATRNIDNWMSAGVAWHFGMQKTINQLTTMRFALIADVANRAGRWPAVILAYFVTPDTVGHDCGPDSTECLDMFLDIDRQIGHICRSLEAAGLLDRSYLTLVSDHGFVPTPQVFDVAAYFEKTLKIPTISRMYGRDVAFEKRAVHFARARAVVVTGGNRRSSIHLRHGDHWWRRPTYRQIESFPGGGGSLSSLLARCPGVELVMVRRGDNAVLLRTATGTGEIDRAIRDGRKCYRYRVVSGADPLGYTRFPKARALMDNHHHDGRAWLAATLDTGKPDCVAQLVEMNDSHRSGDIVLFASDGWALGASEKGGHGGLLSHEIIVPWVWAGPGLPAGGRITGARTVDLMPTILHLIGRAEAIPPGLDGRNIAGRLKAAAPKARALP